MAIFFNTFNINYRAYEIPYLLFTPRRKRASPSQGRWYRSLISHLENQGSCLNNSINPLKCPLKTAVYHCYSLNKAVCQNLFIYSTLYLLLTYDKNIDGLFFCCNSFTSFTLFEGTDVCSIVSRKNRIDIQTSIRKLGEPSLVQQCSTLFLPKHLWGWSTFNTTA